MRFQAEHHFDGPEEAVAEVLADPSFYLALDLPDLGPPELLGSSDDGDRAIIRLRYEFVGTLDPVARRLIGSDRLAWVQGGADRPVIVVGLPELRGRGGPRDAFTGRRSTPWSGPRRPPSVASVATWWWRCRASVEWPNAGSYPGSCADSISRPRRSRRACPEGADPPPRPGRPRVADRLTRWRSWLASWWRQGSGAGTSSAGWPPGRGAPSPCWPSPRWRPWPGRWRWRWRWVGRSPPRRPGWGPAPERSA